MSFLQWNSIPLFLETLTQVTKLNEALMAIRPPWNRVGTYIVLSHESTLTLHDALGQQATYEKSQHIRFTQDNVIAYQDMAWGDGDIFTEYQCTPGKPVDQYKEGHRYRILISLRQTKNQGDETHIHIKRQIHEGFVRTREDFQTEINHHMQHLRLKIVFPPERPPRRVYLVEQNVNHSTPLLRDSWQTQPDGHVTVMWETKRPRLFEAYILGWEW